MVIQFLKPQGSFRVGDESSHLPDTTVKQMVSERSARLVPEPWMLRYEKETVDPYEGEVLHLYLDTRGLVTMGKGCQVSLAECLTILFYKDGRPATSDEIAADYRRVQGMATGMRADRYACVGALGVSRDESEMLLYRRFASLTALMRRLFPGFDGWPDEAKMGSVEVPWGVGEGDFAHGWPHFRDALFHGNFKVAASTCAFADPQGIYAKRNEHRVKLFLAAAAKRAA